MIQLYFICFTYTTIDIDLGYDHMNQANPILSRP